MKNTLIAIGAGLALGISTLVSSAVSVSTTLPPGAVFNLLTTSGNVGSFTVKQVGITATTGTNAVVALYDAPSTNISYINPAYTNRVSYGTNWNTSWTNFYGVVQTNYSPVVALIDITNTVASSTNNYPTRIIAGAAANNSAVFSGVNYYFDMGVLVTNIGSGTATVTVTY
jgi:hypothetical protein